MLSLVLRDTVPRADIFRSAFVITVATLIGHLIPLLPFVLLARTPALVLAIVLSGLVLFGVGVYSAVTLVGDWRKSGGEVARDRPRQARVVASGSKRVSTPVERSTRRISYESCDPLVPKLGVHDTYAMVLPSGDGTATGEIHPL